MATSKYASIIPCDKRIFGLFAHEDEDGEVSVIQLPVVFWGLRQDGTAVGVCAGTRLFEAESDDEFLSYADDTDDPDDWLDEAEDLITRNRPPTVRGRPLS